jgi:hypothetical protein
VSIAPSPEGSLDEASLEALISVLARSSTAGLLTGCFAFYAALPAGDFEDPALRSGPLSGVAEFVAAGEYRSSPTNLWPIDRSWFVWTDWDLMGTKVRGARSLIERLGAHSELETVLWSPT